MKERFMKNGVFSLEYDKETLRDIVLELQQENQELKYNWNKLKKWLGENESFDDYCNETTFTSVLEKMLELEQGSDNQ